MINIDTLIIGGDKYKTFKEYTKDYYETEEEINILKIHLELLKQEKTENNELSYAKLINLYDLVKSKNTEEYNIIKDKLPIIFPKLNEYLELKNKLEVLRNKLTDILRYDIYLEYNDKAHIFIPYKFGLKCIISDEIITGCKTDKELKLLYSIAKRWGLLLTNYQEEDYDYVKELLKNIGLNKDSKNRIIPDYKTWDEEEISNYLNGEYDGIIESHTRYIDYQLDKRHQEKKLNITKKKS